MILIVNFRHAAPGLPLLEICGLPLAARGALEGIQCGYKQICLVVHDVDRLQVARCLKPYNRLQHIQVVSSPEELRRKLQAGKSMQQLEIAVVAGTIVWSGGLLAQLKSSSGQDSSPLQGGPDNPFTRQIVTPEVLLEFARSLFAASPAGILSKGSGPTVADAPASPPLWCAIRSRCDIPAAEDFLLSQLVKKTDGIISRIINRKISLAISRRLMKTAVTPNHITLAVLCIGILSGPAILFFGGYFGLVAGGLLYYLAAILDGCDGEISRLKYMGTPYGAWLDTVVDDTVGLSYILGLYWSLADRVPAWSWAGGAAVFFYLLTLGPRYYIMAAFLGSGDYQRLSAAKSRVTASGMLVRSLRRLEDTVCRTDFIPFTAFVTAIFNIPEIFAGAFLLGTVGSASDSLNTFFAMKRGPRTQAAPEEPST